LANGICEEILKAVPHRHFVFSIPKILRRYFLYDRRILSELSRCAWEALKEFFQEVVPEDGAVPGAVIAIHTFGDFLGWHPHLHILCTDGCFYGNGMFRVAPLFKLKHLEAIFRHKVFTMLLSKGKITQDMVDMLMSWRHSGFNVFCGSRIQPGDENAMENLARYIIRASFSQERMAYIPEESEVIYRSKDGKEEKVFDALEWLAAMCSHVPNKGEQMVRYYGYYYLDEFTFRFNRRTSQHRGKLFYRLVQQAMHVDPLPYGKIIKHVRGPKKRDHNI
jgi:hypothetical protein